MFRRALSVGFALSIGLSVLVASTSAESLAGAARREQERRQKNKEQGVQAPVIDETTVKTVAPSDVGSSTGTPAPAETSSQSDTFDAEAEARQKSEADWRHRVTDAQSRIDEAQKDIDALSELWLNPGQRYVDANGQTVIHNQAEIEGMRNKAQRNLEEAKEAMDRLLEDARRAGVPPGWLR